MELERNPLWLILVETVHALPMYPSHKAYVRDTLILESPDISAEELSLRLDIPLGELWSSSTRSRKRKSAQK